MDTEDVKRCNINKLSSHFQYQELIVCENKYLVGACKINNCLQIILTDLTNYYEEKLSKEESVKRVEELNPLLPDCSIDEILDDLLSNIPKYTVSCNLQCIELENKIEDGRFWFHINLTKTDSKPYFNQNIDNIYISLSELLYRYNYLLDLVKKKDREIDEYKEQGVNILRKSLITEKFNEELFQTKLKKIEPVEKINIFLETMSFFNSVNKSSSSKDLKENERFLTKSERTDGVSEKSSTNKKIAVKKPPSSDIRCAVITKMGKKAKPSKKSSLLKHV